jgi:iron-sulfur cluster repair protein YtfE (RIC family)
MPATTAASSRSQSAARTQVLKDLKDDHKRVKKAYKEFEKLDAHEDADECEAIVQDVLDELTLHALLEEELLYPAAREALGDDGVDLVDEAEVEHESMHEAIDRLRDMGAGDEKFAARFTVLCEYVLHHVKEEEGELFPMLEKAKLDWESIAQAMQARRDETLGTDGEPPSDDDGDDDEDAPESGNESGKESSKKGAGSAGTATRKAGL